VIVIVIVIVMYCLRSFQLQRVHKKKSKPLTFSITLDLIGLKKFSKIRKTYHKPKCAIKFETSSKYAARPPLYQSLLHVELGEWTPYNIAADMFHKTKLCSRLSSSESRFF